MNKVLLASLMLLPSFAAKAQYDFFLPGSYYTSAGEKVTGLIYFSGSSTATGFYFRTDKKTHFKKIAIADIKALVMDSDPDSLVAVTENGKDDKKYLFKFWCSTPVTTFYYKEHDRFSPGNPDVGLGAPVGRSSGAMLTNLIPMYLEGNTAREITKANYIDVLSKAFADDTTLVQKIQNKEFKFKQLGEIFEEYKQESTNYKGR